MNILDIAARLRAGDLDDDEISAVIALVGAVVERTLRAPMPTLLEPAAHADPLYRVLARAVIALYDKNRLHYVDGGLSGVRLADVVSIANIELQRIGANLVTHKRVGFVCRRVLGLQTARQQAFDRAFCVVANAAQLENLGVLYGMD